jgi:hypothetical protein
VGNAWTSTAGTLISARELRRRFPSIGDVRPPDEPNRLVEHDFGPQYDAGISSHEPPRLDPSHEYAVLVPATDSDGTELREKHPARPPHEHVAHLDGAISIKW